MHEIVYNKYIHSIGHWNNQSIVPMEVEPCQGCNVNKKVWERIQKIAEQNVTLKANWRVRRTVINEFNCMEQIYKRFQAPFGLN